MFIYIFTVEKKLPGENCLSRKSLISGGLTILCFVSQRLCDEHFDGNNNNKTDLYLGNEYSEPVFVVRNTFLIMHFKYNFYPVGRTYYSAQR